MRTIEARATVNLNGVRAGQLIDVDPDEPRVAALLNKGYLVNTDPYATVGPEPTTLVGAATGRTRTGQAVPADGSEHELASSEADQQSQVEIATRPFELPPANE